MDLAWIVLCISFFIGIVVCILFYVPTTLYVIPYILWLSSQRLKGEYKEITCNQGVFRDVRNATAVYLSVFTRKKPDLK